MRHFKYDLRPHYPDWGEPVRSYFEKEFEKVFVLLNPFIKVPVSYNKNNEEHNIWAGADNIDYPTDEFILKNCEEIKWKQIIEMSELTTINEINHALKDNGLKKEFQNERLADTLFHLCDSNSFYYPPDGNLTPFNIKKTITLLTDLKINKIQILSEFGDEDQELENSYEKLTGLNLGNSSILSDDKNLLLTNHWDSFMTVLATNYKIDKTFLENYDFEVLMPDDKFTLDARK